MSTRSTTHSTFTIERTYDASPERVFAAWSSLEAKSRWFGGANDTYELDFRVGGLEHSRMGASGGAVYTYDARYEDIVPDERIVYTYSMLMDDDRISVSVATVELAPEGDGTKLSLTEQGAYLDGHDKPEDREHGTNWLLDKLGEALGVAVAAG